MWLLQKIPEILALSRKGLHPYIDDMFFMKSAEPMLIIAISYLIFVLWLGPKYMKNRPPYNLKWVLVIYNAIQVCICLYMLNMFRVGSKKYPASWLFSFGCVINLKDHMELIRMVVDGGWWYVMTKQLDLLDTVFFVLRKKQNQVTFLHLYHHTGMAVCTWIALKFIIAEEFMFLGLINTAVHTVMYFYYFCSAFGPQMQKYLWWKRYITKIQLGQFFIGLIYFLCFTIFGCKNRVYVMPLWMWISLLCAGLLLIYLFLDFYWKAYCKNEERKFLKREANRKAKALHDENSNSVKQDGSGKNKKLK